MPDTHGSETPCTFVALSALPLITPKTPFFGCAASAAGAIIAHATAITRNDLATRFMSDLRAADTTQMRPCTPTKISSARARVRLRHGDLHRLPGREPVRLLDAVRHRRHGRPPLAVRPPRHAGDGLAGTRPGHAQPGLADAGPLGRRDRPEAVRHAAKSLGMVAEGGRGRGARDAEDLPAVRDPGE